MTHGTVITGDGVVLGTAVGMIGAGMVDIVTIHGHIGVALGEATHGIITTGAVIPDGIDQVQAGMDTMADTTVVTMVVVLD